MGHPMDTLMRMQSAYEIAQTRKREKLIRVRRAGAIHAFDALNHFFLISEMIVPGSSYWNIGIGLEVGDVEKDDEAIQTMKTLGQNMAWLLKKIKN